MTDEQNDATPEDGITKIALPKISAKQIEAVLHANHHLSERNLISKMKDACYSAHSQKRFTVGNIQNRMDWMKPYLEGNLTSTGADKLEDHEAKLAVQEAQLQEWLADVALYEACYRKVAGEPYVHGRRKSAATPTASQLSAADRVAQTKARLGL